MLAVVSEAAPGALADEAAGTERSESVKPLRIPSRKEADAAPPTSRPGTAAKDAAAKDVPFRNSSPPPSPRNVAHHVKRLLTACVAWCRSFQCILCRLGT